MQLLVSESGVLLTVCRFYTLSIILGTVALSYGSVPLYKMVGYSSLGINTGYKLTTSF